MSKFGKLNRNKIALALACMSIFKGENLGATSNKNLKKIEQDLSILEKVLVGAGITIGVGLAVNEAVGGAMWAMGKESDSIIKGEYSFMNLLRSKIRKDESDSSDSEHRDEKKVKNVKTKNKKGEYYEANIKIIEESSKLSRENIERLIDMINDTDNSFLDNIRSVHIVEEMYKYAHYGEMYEHPLNKEIIERFRISKGNSWVEKIFDGIRGKFEITHIANKHSMWQKRY